MPNLKDVMNVSGERNQMAKKKPLKTRLQKLYLTEKIKNAKNK